MLAKSLFTFVSLEVEARGSCTSSHVFISWSFFGSWMTFFLILVGWAWQHVWLWEYHPMVWNLSVALSLSSVPMLLDVKTSTCGIPQTALAKEHPEPEDLLSEPFCLKCTKAIPDWYQLFVFSLIIWSAALEMMQALRLTRVHFAEVMCSSFVLSYFGCIYPIYVGCCFGTRNVQSKVLSSCGSRMGSTIWFGSFAKSYNCNSCDWFFPSHLGFKLWIWTYNHCALGTIVTTPSLTCWEYYEKIVI